MEEGKQLTSDGMLNLAMGVFGTDKAAKHWLRNPVEELGWKRPTDLMRTPVGKREVRDLLARMEKAE
jgi:putative toxin-antitoxin system antitoxin component (TIGR02293 family)